jgi:hypothetical protein
MKKLIYLFLALIIVACSSDDSNNSNNGCPINFECSTATANDFLNLDGVNEEYQSNVSQFGEPISDGLYQNNDDGYYYSWVWAEDCISVSCSDCSYIIFNDCP